MSRNGTNSALDLDYGVSQRKATNKKADVIRMPYKERKARKKLNFKSMAKKVGLATVAACMCGMLIYGQIQVNENTREIATAQKSLSTLETKATELRSSLVKKAKLTDVENYAVWGLGMQEIKSNQIQYIYTNSSDDIEVSQTNKDEGFLQMVWSSIVSFFK